MRRRLVTAAGAMAVAATVGLGGCSTLEVPASSSGLTRSQTLAPKTYKALKFAVTVKQGLDFTCGGAALATVLTHYWKRETTELEILKILQTRYPDDAAWKAKIKSGFSLEDLQFAAETLGFESQAAQAPVDSLEQLNGPVIVHLKKTATYLHFSVLRKAAGGTFYLSDPILGLYAMTRPQFEAQYTGYLMAVWRKDGKLPRGSPLATVRDGLAVSPTMSDIIRQGSRPLVRTF